MAPSVDAEAFLVPVPRHQAQATAGVRVTLHEVPGQDDMRWSRLFATKGLVFLVGYKVPQWKQCTVLKLDAANPTQGQAVELRSPIGGLAALGLGALWLEAPDNLWSGARKLWRVDQGTMTVTSTPLPRTMALHDLTASFNSLWSLGSDQARWVRLQNADPVSGDVLWRQLVSKKGGSCVLVTAQDAAWVHVSDEARVVRIDPDGLSEPTSFSYPRPNEKSWCGRAKDSIAATPQAVWLLRCGDAALLRLDSTTGQVSGPLNAGVQLVSLQADEERLLGASAGGRRIHLLDGDSGATQAEVLLPDDPRDSSLADGSLWVLTSSLASGARLWQVTFPAEARALPAPPSPVSEASSTDSSRRDLMEGIVGVANHGAVVSDDVKVEAWSAAESHASVDLQFVKDGQLWLSAGPKGAWRGTDLYRIDMRAAPSVTRFELPPGPWDMLAPADGFAWALTQGTDVWHRSRMLRIDLATGRASTDKERDDQVEHGLIAFGSLWTSQLLRSDLRRFDLDSGERLAAIEIPSGTGGALLPTRNALLLMRRAEIHAIDPATNSARLLVRLGERMPSTYWTGEAPLAEAADSLWAVRPSDGALIQLDAAAGQLLAAFSFPWRAAGVLGEGEQLLVLGEGGSYVARGDPATGSILGTALLPAPNPKVLLSQGIAWASSHAHGGGWRLWRIEFPGPAR